MLSCLRSTKFSDKIERDNNLHFDDRNYLKKKYISKALEATWPVKHR